MSEDPQQVYFHLLSDNGKEVEQVLENEKPSDVAFELNQYFLITYDGISRGYLVKEISFHESAWNILLKPLPLGSLH